MNFSELVSSFQRSENGASLQLSDDWLQGRTAYGGLQSALALAAMRQALGGGELPLRSLQVSFIAPVLAGEVRATAQLLRQGRSASQVQASITGESGVAMTALGIFGADRPSKIRQAPKAPAAMDVEGLEELPYLEGITPQFTQHFQQRWGRGQFPFSGAASSEASIFVRHRGIDTMDELHFAALADAIPPAAIALLSKPTMISSMNWTLELLARPEDFSGQPWFRFDTEQTAAGDGYSWQSTRIWSESGKLVALSRQCVAVFDG